MYKAGTDVNHLNSLLIIFATLFYIIDIKLSFTMHQSRKCFTLKEKIKIIKAVDNKKFSVDDVVKQFKCGKSQVYSILKRKAELTEEYNASKSFCC